MTLAKAVELAKAEKEKPTFPKGTKLVIVNAPIENAEDESGPYGYCPEAAKDILFRHGTIIATV